LLASHLGMPLAHPPDMVLVPQTSATVSGHRRVLVVDDDVRSRNAVARLLAEEGYDTAVAADGEEAARLLAPWHPDLVLTDLNMPRLDGRGLLLRVQSVLPDTPVIVLSARGSAETGAAALETMGAAGYFPKPIKVDDLLARIHDLIGH
jgi:DNA-binding response OmpR family regulator